MKQVRVVAVAAVVATCDLHAASDTLDSHAQHICLQHTISGTSLRYKPGVIICGGGLVHDCGASRAIGYFLEALVLLALFAKKVGAVVRSSSRRRFAVCVSFNSTCS